MNDAFQHRKRRARRWHFFWLGAGLLVLIGIGGALAMGSGEMLVGKTDESAGSASRGNIVKAAALLGANDSDHDGLKDWEEEIYQTDPAKQDTDGDGTPDGDEVAANRDPVVAGPNDTATVSPDTYGSPEESITARLLLGIQQSLTPEMIAGLEQGIADPSALQGLSNALSSIDPHTLVTTEAVTRKDITVTDATGGAAARNYFNAVADALLTEFGPFQGRQTVVFKKIGESGDLGGLADLDPIITAYTNSIARIRAVPVPREYEPFALEELTHLARARDVLQAIRASGDDPIRAALLIVQRGRLDTAYRAFLRRNSDELIARGVRFAGQDSGRIFVDERTRS